MAILRCPICQQNFDSETTRAMPFCSPRCKQIDLGRWFNEEYRLPIVPDPEDDEPSESLFPDNGDANQN